MFPINHMKTLVQQQFVYELEVYGVCPKCRDSWA